MVEQYFSKEGLEKLKQEYEHRTGQLRIDISARIKEAKEQGDLSENAEYSEAKEAQSLNEGRIEELKIILDNAVLISKPTVAGVVSVGSHIRVSSSGSDREFMIVGASEADPINGKISNESPLGSAFLGSKKGERVKVHTPKGEVEYHVLEVK
ncbi:MAG: transcription elongation factor GreA [Candidatus Pacebacteria bacterium]|nr:transcription elongation factor GreA [Candidatus Paceibacterota bacterium]